LILFHFFDERKSNGPHEELHFHQPRHSKPNSALNLEWTESRDERKISLLEQIKRPPRNNILEYFWRNYKQFKGLEVTEDRNNYLNASNWILGMQRLPSF